MPSDRKSIAKRMEAGEEPDLIVPMDYLLLAQLPLEGQLIAGLYEMGMTVQELQSKEPFKSANLTPDAISGRLRAMKWWGLAKDIKSLGLVKGSRSWQITKAGKEVLEKWKAAS